MPNRERETCVQIQLQPKQNWPNINQKTKTKMTITMQNYVRIAVLGFFRLYRPYWATIYHRLSPITVSISTVGYLSPHCFYTLLEFLFQFPFASDVTARLLVRLLFVVNLVSNVFRVVTPVRTSSIFLALFVLNIWSLNPYGMVYSNLIPPDIYSDA